MAKKKKNREDKTEIIQVTESAGWVYFLSNQYEDGGNGDGVGNIHAVQDPRSRSEVPRHVLWSNDTVRVMWASPSGALWTGSADSLVATQAATRWGRYSGDADYDANGGPAWSVTALPPASADDLDPNVTALWGLDDGHVWAGTFSGDIYQGGTQGWTQVYDGDPDGRHTINAFGGSAPDDVFAVGNDGRVLHFDGKAWTRLRLPGLPNGSETWSSVHTLPNGEVLILGTGDESRLLYGTARNLSEFGRYPLQLIDMAPLGDNRLLFATTEGVAELVGHQVQLIQTEHAPITAAAGDGRVFFTEAEQPRPAYVEYDPRQAEQPWALATY